MTREKNELSGLRSEGDRSMLRGCYEWSKEEIVLTIHADMH